MLENLIKEAMAGHIFSFNGTIYRQASGGAIGNILTGALAALFMVWWSRQFKQKLMRATSDIPGFKLILQKYYVDDGTNVTTPLPLGSRLENDKIVIDENQIVNDREIPADIRTSKILVEIGNGICEFINLTVDSPSKNESGWMPLLDLQVMVKNNQILYKFFKKSMSSKYVMMQNSAMPMKIKRNALVQEVIRRLRNTSRSLQWSIKAEILSEFSYSMKMSGWSEKFRQETIQSGVLGYERQC